MCLFVLACFTTFWALSYVMTFGGIYVCTYTPRHAQEVARQACRKRHRLETSKCSGRVVEWERDVCSMFGVSGVASGMFRTNESVFVSYTSYVSLGVHVVAQTKIGVNTRVVMNNSMR